MIPSFGKEKPRLKHIEDSQLQSQRVYLTSCHGLLVIDIQATPQ